MEKVVPGEPFKGSGLMTYPLKAKMPTHYFVKILDPKRYEYKFRVDGQWRFAPDQQTTRDDRGNENNCVDLT